ncbi:hypothetical protein K488DRAFT_65726, partial [Vararia minispora EC-137]
MCVWEYASCVFKEVGTIRAEERGQDRRRAGYQRFRFDPEHPQHASHVLGIRGVAHVPVLAGPPIPCADRSEDEKSRFHRAMLILFKPWRVVDDLLPEGMSWTQSFHATTFSPYLAQIIRNIHVENECQDARIESDRIRR